MIVSEPNEYFGNHNWAIANKEYFSLILSWSDKVLRQCENSSFLVYGESWFDDKHIFESGTKNAKKREKDFSVSFLRGNKFYRQDLKGTRFKVLFYSENFVPRN